MRAADLWCNLVQRGRAAHTKRQKRPAPTFGVPLGSSTNSRHFRREDGAEWGGGVQVNNETRTDLIHYLVRMMMAEEMSSLYTKTESNYPVINTRSCTHFYSPWGGKWRSKGWECCSKWSWRVHIWRRKCSGHLEKSLSFQPSNNGRQFWQISPQSCSKPSTQLCSQKEKQ